MRRPQVRRFVLSCPGPSPLLSPSPAPLLPFSSRDTAPGSCFSFSTRWVAIVSVCTPPPAPGRYPPARGGGLLAEPLSEGARAAPNSRSRLMEPPSALEVCGGREMPEPGVGPNLPPFRFRPKRVKRSAAGVVRREPFPHGRARWWRPCFSLSPFPEGKGLESKVAPPPPPRVGVSRLRNVLKGAQ